MAAGDTKHVAFRLVVYFKHPGVQKLQVDFVQFDVSVDTSFDKHRVFLPTCGIKNLHYGLENYYRVSISKQLLPNASFAHYFAFFASLIS